MKNVFVTAQYNVENRYSFGETSQEDYRQLTMKCVDSFMRNLVDLDEVVILTGNVVTYHELFKDIYFLIRDIWRGNESANILWSDSDNICLKQLDVFGRFVDFAMFASGDQHRLSFTNPQCLDMVKNLTPWMMANLRYYPNDMPTKLWEIGDNLAHSWINEWAYETIIYNKMYHAQDIKPVMIPEWNVQAEGPVGMINPEMVRDATIIHCQSTRGSREAILKIKRALKFKEVVI